MKRGFFARWYRTRGRHYPWRSAVATPYQILITEILLHQTRANDVIRIWEKLFAKYPDADSLSRSSPSELHRLIRELGFGSWRTRALRLVAKSLVEFHGGNVPSNLAELMEIPFVGPYTAGAVMTFAFQRREAIVDTNVLRLFSRYFGRSFGADIRRTKEPWEIARKLLPARAKHTAAHNYGILDFTAEICRPLKPRCQECPLSRSCEFVVTKDQAPRRG